MNMKRMRGRNHRPNSGGGGAGGFRNQQNGIPLNRNHVFDSSGPEMRVRGTAQQLYDKYQQMARDAFSNGDRVTGESYYQHAEHYFRIISAINQAQGVPNQPQNGQNGQSYQPNGQDRNQDRGNYQDRSSYNSDRDYNRRDVNLGDVSTEPQPELRTEPRQEVRQETRQETPRYEPRPTQYRHNDPRNPEPRSELRPPKPDYQRQARPDRAERYRAPEVPVIDPRIDISSALEAELAATVPEPPQPEFAGFGDQPVIQARTEPRAETRSETIEKPRAIPIIPESPPPAAPPAEEPVVRAPRPRGRPRAVKPEAEKASE